MKRSFDPAEHELMDLSRPVSPELERDLQNLRQINRYFGSHTLIRAFLKQWLRPGKSYTVLDLATGSGDIPRMMVDWARRKKISLRVDALDAQASTLEIARRLSADYPEISYIHGDMRSFVPGQSYSLVCSFLALHHFSNDDAVRLLRHMRELSYDKVLVADLERGLFTQVSVYLLTALLFRDPMTRYDARLSAKRAFSFREFKELARLAGWEDFGHRRFIPARQALWLNLTEVAPAYDFGLPASGFAPGQA